MSKAEDVKKAMAAGYDKAISECKYGASLYIAGFLDGMNYQKDGTIPEDLLSKFIRENKKGKKDEQDRR